MSLWRNQGSIFTSFGNFWKVPKKIIRYILLDIIWRVIFVALSSPVNRSIRRILNTQSCFAVSLYLLTHTFSYTLSFLISLMFFIITFVLFSGFKLLWKQRSKTLVSLNSVRIVYWRCISPSSLAPKWRKFLFIF